MTGTKWRAFVANNLGLLLVAASELFFAFMHLAVKILNGIDPPVTSFEVCVLLPVSVTRLNFFVLAYLGSYDYYLCL